MLPYHANYMLPGRLNYQLRMPHRKVGAGGGAKEDRVSLQWILKQ